MLISELHERFRVNLDKIDSFSAPEYTPEHIDILLNQAQDRLIEQVTAKGIESTQTVTDYISKLIVSANINTFSNDQFSETGGYYANLPDNYRKMVKEKLLLAYPNCSPTKSGNIKPNTRYFVIGGSLTYANNLYTENNTFISTIGYYNYTGTGKAYEAVNNTKTIVKPVTRDKFMDYINNPFKEPDTDIVLRLAVSRTNVPKTYELVLPIPSKPLTYAIDYIRQPAQIRWGTQYATPTTDVECELDIEAQIKIVDWAVEEAKQILAFQSKEQVKQLT